MNPTTVLKGGICIASVTGGPPGGARGLRPAPHRDSGRFSGLDAVFCGLFWYDVTLNASLRTWPPKGETLW